MRSPKNRLPLQFKTKIMNYPDLEKDWNQVVYKLIQLTGKKPNTNSALFLIGVQELGLGKKTFSKEEKQDLMHIATCKILSLSNFYKYIGNDQEGWPHYELVEELPKLSLEEQEKFIQWHICQYFKEYF